MRITLVLGLVFAFRVDPARAAAHVVVPPGVSHGCAESIHVNLYFDCASASQPTSSTSRLEPVSPAVRERTFICAVKSFAWAPRRPAQSCGVGGWGTAPTPLLPEWYRRALPSLPLPDQIRDLNPAAATVGDLDAFWVGAYGTHVGEAALRSLIELVGSYRPPPTHIVVPEGVDRVELADYPLRVRTLNTLLKAGALEGRGSLSVDDLLSIVNFGVVSLLDLMCVVEDHPSDSLLQTHTATDEPPGREPVRQNSDPTTRDAGPSARNDLIPVLRQLFSAAAEFFGAATVAEALHLDLAALASRLELDSALDSLAIRDLTHGHSLASEVLGRVGAIEESLSPRERLIVEQRLLASHPATLAALGRKFSISYQRVGQLQERLTPDHRSADRSRS